MTMRELTDTILNEVLSLNAQEYGSLSIREDRTGRSSMKS